MLGIPSTMRKIDTKGVGKSRTHSAMATVNHEDGDIYALSLQNMPKRHAFSREKRSLIDRILCTSLAASTFQEIGTKSTGHSTFSDV